MRSYGSSFDVAPDGLAEQTMRVSQSHSYELAIVHYRRRVGVSGLVTCQTLKVPGAPGRRMVQLLAEYVEAGIATQHIVGVEDHADELRQLERLERQILAAERRPEAIAPSWQRQANGRVGCPPI